MIMLFVHKMGMVECFLNGQTRPLFIYFSFFSQCKDKYKAHTLDTQKFVFVNHLSQA